MRIKLIFGCMSVWALLGLSEASLASFLESLFDGKAGDQQLSASARFWGGPLFNTLGAMMIPLLAFTGMSSFVSLAPTVLGSVQGAFQQATPQQAPAPPKPLGKRRRRDADHGYQRTLAWVRTVSETLDLIESALEKKY